MLNKIPCYTESSAWKGLFQSFGYIPLNEEKEDKKEKGEEESGEKEEGEKEEDKKEKEEGKEKQDKKEDKKDKTKKQEKKNESEILEGSIEKDEDLLSQEEKFLVLQEYEKSITAGFQAATLSGPLCDEQVEGVCFIVEEIFIKQGSLDSIGPFSGQLFSTIKSACRSSFLLKSARLIQPMFSLHVQFDSTHFGKVSTALGKRKARIQEEVINEGTSICALKAFIPAVESFGLAREIRTETSGSASVQLVFSHFELYDEDPFFAAATEDELEEFGENLGSLAPNLALKYMNLVRKRKGLAVEEKVIEHAEKQRNLSKKV